MPLVPTCKDGKDIIRIISARRPTRKKRFVVISKATELNEMTSWLNTWGAENETECPACHK